MTKKITETSFAVAEAVKLCKPAVVAIYPITPQTHIPEAVSEFINNGELDSEVIHAESEHSALSAASGASASGVRAYTATASQGLALMHEILHIVSGMRLPVVMNVVNRALAAPINIWCDHSDSMSARDTGWIQIYVESAQEALDTTVQAFKIAENREICLPVMVCLDGFSLSHVYEPVDLPKQGKINRFLPKYKPLFPLEPKKPLTLGPIGYPDSFIFFKHQQHVAMKKAIQVIKKVNSEYGQKFGKRYGDGLIETYKLKNADYAIVALGSVCGTVKTVVDELQKKGHKAGLIRIRTFRPFPEDEIIAACQNLSGVAVLDRSISLGQKGAVFSELTSAFFSRKKAPLIHSFIGGLGGRDITPKDIEIIFNKIVKAKSSIAEWMM